MTEKVTVELGGKSKYEIAHIIAINILTAEQQNVMSAGRKAYLQAVAEAIDALAGIHQR